MKLLKNGMYFLLALSLAVACKSDDDNTGGETSTITNLAFEATITGNSVSVLPSSTGGSSYSVDFGDPAAENNADVLATAGPAVSYTYPNADMSTTYSINVTASASTAENVSLAKDIVIAAYEAPTTDALGRWVLLHEAGSLAVGESATNLGWWTSSLSDVATRDCLFDDVYEFKADGSFENTLGDQTWGEPWSGTDPEACASPVAPYDGTATATWSHDESAGTIVISGSGAFLGLPKVANVEFDLANASTITSVTYTSVSFSEDKNTMTVQCDYGAGVWQFKFAREGTPGASVPDTDTDGDGVNDVDDACPDVAGLPQNDGCPATTSRSDAMDDFEGAGNVTWSPDGGTTYDATFANPSATGINTSSTVLKYNDNGDTYANIRFDLNSENSEKFDLSTKNIFKVKVFVPTPTTAVTQPLQLALKLQDGSEAEPWNGQTEVIQTYTYDTWQELTFDFSGVSSETKYSRIVVQFNGENNNEVVEAYIDDISQN